MAYQATFELPSEEAVKNPADSTTNYVLGETLERLYERVRGITGEMTLILKESFGIGNDFMQFAHPLGSGKVEMLIHNLNSEARVLFAGFRHPSRSGLLKILGDFFFPTEEFKITETA